MLAGPEGSGKSHLAAIWAQAAGARRISARALDEGKVPAAADHEPGVGDERLCRRREALGAVLTDADDGKPTALLTGRAHNATSLVP